MARGKGLGEYVNPFEQPKKKGPKKQEADQSVVEDKKEKDPQPIVEDQKETENLSALSKYKKVPKYKTYVAHNVRIPREMRRDLEVIAKKLGIKLGKNTGFFQEFTIDALRVHIEKAKKELDIDD